MQKEERKQRALEILTKMGLGDLEYLGQGFEGVVFHNANYVYKVILPFFEGGDKWYTYRHLTFFFEKREYKSFYHLDEVLEFEGLFIEKYPYEASEPVVNFSEKDAIQFLTECWQKKVIIQDCKRENFIRVNGTIKLIDLDGCKYYSDDFFLNACARMFIFIHEQDNPQLKKLQRSAINNFDLPELDGFREFVNKIFSNIIYEESRTAIHSFKINPQPEFIYEICSCSDICNLDLLFFSKLREHLYLSDIQFDEPKLSGQNTFVPPKIALGFRKISPLRRKVSLLIKTCAQDVLTIESNIRHIVRQLSCPNYFHEVVVSIDCREGGFVRQYTAKGNLNDVIAITEKLKNEGVIDRIILFDVNQAEAVNQRWFGIATKETHSIKGVPIASQPYAFENCEGDYILQMDSDVMIGRSDYNHSFMDDMLNELESNDKVISVGFNIPVSQSNPYFGFEDGGFVPEVRMGLFDKKRMFGLRPYPNSADENDKLKLTWYRSMEQYQKQTGYCSIRGGDKRSFYVHPQNYRKTNPYSWMNILDRIEQGYILDKQINHFDCEGSFFDWSFPKRNEKMVVLSCFRNVSIERFLRFWCSLMSQRFQDFSIILYDDCSDNGIQYFIDYLIEPYSDRITFIKGRTRLEKLQCEYIALHNYCNNPDSIIVMIDADDALIGKDALYDIYKKYAMWGVDTTCGRVHQTYRIQPHYRYPVDFMNPRKHGGNVWQHLKTFKKYLFDSIPLSYFMYNDNEAKFSQRKWFEKCDDYAIMVPIVEMSESPYQMDFINYYYEREYENRDANRDIKERCIKEILEKKKLSPQNVYKKRKTFFPQMDKIEIDITFDCNLKCKGCNRSCGLAPSRERMDLQDIKRFVQESIQLNIKWKLINILGGEPTLHPQLKDILGILQTEYADAFNNDVIIQVVSNRYTKQSRNICEEIKSFKNVRIDYESTKDDNETGYFTPFADAPIDDPNFKDEDYQKACWVASYCGIGLNKNGYYGCSVCGGISRILNDGEGVKSLAELTESVIKSHFEKYCKLCGNFKHYSNSHGDFLLRCEKDSFREIISPTWERLYKEYNRQEKIIK